MVGAGGGRTSGKEKIGNTLKTEEVRVVSKSMAMIRRIEVGVLTDPARRLFLLRTLSRERHNAIRIQRSERL